MVSPGVIDMGGLLITPVEKDFERLDGAEVENIYREVSLEGRPSNMLLRYGIVPKCNTIFQAVIWLEVHITLLGHSLSLGFSIDFPSLSLGSSVVFL